MNENKKINVSRVIYYVALAALIIATLVLIYIAIRLSIYDCGSCIADPISYYNNLSTHNNVICSKMAA